jgi:hypothetical protein
VFTLVILPFLQQSFLEVRDNLEDLGVDGRIILRWMLNNHFIDLAYDRDKRRVLVNTAINL